MNSSWLITTEILLVVVTPLLFLYLKSNWPLRTITLSVVSIPILWYFCYAPLHELSHIAGIYAVGGTVVEYKLIPRFWMGEYARAWITPEGLTENSQRLVMSSAPYVLDIACVVAGLLVLRKRSLKNPFVIGLIFMLLCLRPTFDFVCEPIAFLFGDEGDLYAIQMIVGCLLTWVFVLLSLAFCLFSIVAVLFRFVSAPNPLSVESGT